MSLTTLIKASRIYRISQPVIAPISVRQYGFFSKEEPVINEEPIKEELEGMAEDGYIIDEMRNKSRLGPISYAKMHKVAPQLTEDQKQAYSLKRLRRIYGEYGTDSGIDVGLLWPSIDEMRLMKEKERVEFPDDIHRMIEIDKQTKKEAAEKIQKRQADLAASVAKLENWKKEVRQRYQTKLKQAEEQKAKKEKLIEEIRQMLGYRVSTKDEKFKEALEKKELEEKKAAKALKKLKRQQKALADIQRMTGNTPSDKVVDSSEKVHDVPAPSSQTPNEVKN